ncbi:MAG TPA: hypothetical protein VFK06_13870 [Candidatus Angelobacter sp.]|nr:hypothetical protein [Candidatus Angelobacter sp.]
MKFVNGLALCCLLTSVTFSQCDNVKLMTWKQYSHLSPKWPYVLRINSHKANLLYYGAAHTYKPDDPQLAEIEKLWAEFRPDIAFNEGGDPPIEASRDEAIRKSGEPGLIRFLANRDHIPVTSVDQSRAEEVAFLLKRFSSEQVKLFFVLRLVAQQTRNHPEQPLEDELRRVLPIFAGTPGLNVPPGTSEELAMIYARNFPNHGSYKEASLSWFDPTKSENYLNEMARQLNLYRDQYMVNLIVRHVREGQRVFAVVGGSHLVMQEPAIRRLVRRSMR